jgi:hypothetical protein
VTVGPSRVVLPARSHAAQAKRERDPGTAVENQVNSNEETDNPEARGGPFCKHQQT